MCFRRKPNSGANVYNVLFAFKPDLATPWVRLTSNGATTLPNPAVSFTAGLSLDIYSDKPLYLSLLLRETNTQEPIGGNGGTANGIEFVGGVPTGASKGKLVPANTWTTLVFDIPTESVTAFAGTTANGILESTTGKGALEALGIAADANSAGVYNIYLDNIQVIPEPSVITLFGLVPWRFSLAPVVKTRNRKLIQFLKGPPQGGLFASAETNPFRAGTGRRELLVLTESPGRPERSCGRWCA